MSSPWNNYGLPFLPGYSFPDYTFHDLRSQKSAFHRPQTLDYKNGYPLAQRLSMGIGQELHLSEQLSTTAQHLSDLSFGMPGEDPYGASDRKVYEPFKPVYVALDKKVLCFKAFFKEEFLNSSEEYRVCPVVIYYHLEDDTMTIVEPKEENSGFEHGKRLKRQKIPKNDHGEYYLWKDLNIGMDLKVYGFTYHITQCDDFTKEFMESEGIILNEPEPTPEDPYIKKRKGSPQPHTQPSTTDKLHQFLTMDGKVLSFSALGEDVNRQYTLPVTIHYFLVDDTVEIREVVYKGRRQNHFPVVMRRVKIPKKMKSETFPTCVMEISHLDVDEYYSPKDFQLGQTVTLLARSFLLCDCDDFTKKYYKENHPDMEMKPLEVPEKVDTPQKEKKNPPKVEKNLENLNKVLRYKAKLVSPYPEDKDRSFILMYSLFNQTISIFEKGTSSFDSGFLLRNRHVPKPGSSQENPDLYSPADFAIGATSFLFFLSVVFSHRFILTDADLYVLKYLESISDQVPSQTLDSLRQKLSTQSNNGEEVKSSHVSQVF
ncbi:EF-hand domain-containing protein 1 isoform X4 [Oryzias latipes]|uniref:EF-hand domain-containing protein 1 isoform X4 n=1 Tax=Oryzias latipes TaxID=8090 RepID=UPI0009D9E90A|nr:EF-hand domain-containing protein 1 isoform X4 [Oryzias latipes]